MATERWYKPGSFYRICDRTGFAVRAERTKKEWTGLLVRDRSFEMRHPQDFVRGRIDPQVVPDPRPRQPNTFVSSTVTLPNLVGQSDQYLAGWPGLIVGPAAVVGIAPDQAVMMLGGSVDAALYLAPATTIIDAGYVRPLQIYTSLYYVAWPNNQAFIGTTSTPIDLFAQGDLFMVSDLFGETPDGTLNIPYDRPVWNSYVDARVEISTSNGALDLFSEEDLFEVPDLFASIDWSDWRPAYNTIYTARYVRFRVWFTTYDENTAIFLRNFSFQVGLA